MSKNNTGTQAENAMVYITDRGYLLPTRVSICSAAAAAKGSPLDIYVVAVELSDEEKEELERLGNKSVRVQVIDTSNSFEDIGLGHPYVSKAALLKFALPELFPDRERILYIDGDTLLNDGFMSIFETDLGDHFMGAVRDMHGELALKRHQLMGHDKYYNSGVLLLNLKKLREYGSREKLIEFKKNDQDSQYMDQNAINGVLGENVLELSPTYNYMTVNLDFFSFSEFEAFFGLTEKAAKEIVKKPAVVHLAGRKKPWNWFASDYYDQWMQYLDISDEIKACLKAAFTLLVRVQDEYYEDQTLRMQQVNDQLVVHAGTIDVHKSRLDALDSMQGIVETHNERLDALDRVFHGLLGNLNMEIEKNKKLEKEISRLGERLNRLENALPNRVKRRLEDTIV